jgi:hypothetical protein
LQAGLFGKFVKGQFLAGHNPSTHLVSRLWLSLRYRATSKKAFYRQLTASQAVIDVGSQGIHPPHE